MKCIVNAAFPVHVKVYCLCWHTVLVLHYAKKILADMRTEALFYVIQEFIDIQFGP